MSSISSVSCTSLASYSSVKNTQKSDSSSLVDKLFEKLDTKQQGYVDKSELQTALTSATSKASGTSSTSADDLFAKMDADGDGKITKQEMGNTLQSLMDQVENMAAKMRVQGSAGGSQANGSGDDKGFTKDELVQMAQDTSETDSKRSEFMSNIADNFDKADADGNGKVTRDEAMSYAKSTGQEMGGPSGSTGPSGGMPPPPPGGGAPAGGGASTTADASTTSDSSTSTDPADTNGDGTVSAKEALSYLLAQLSTDQSSSTTASSSTSDSSGFSDKIARQIMQLVQAYGSNNSATAANDDGTSISSSLSVSA